MHRSILHASRRCGARVARPSSTPTYTLRHYAGSAAPPVVSLTDLIKSPSTFTKSNPVTVHGFVRSVQKFRRVGFARVGDGRSLGHLQVVLTPDQVKGLATGAAVSVTGTVEPSAGDGQEVELRASDIKMVGSHDAASYPIQKKYHTLEFLRTVPHLRMRIPQQSLLLHLRSDVIATLTAFFAGRRIVQSHTPIITSSDCEGAGEVFGVALASDGAPAEGLKKQSCSTNDQPQSHFFKSQKFLTVSSQLHLEAYAQAVGSAWTLSPCFRAERSDTPRHLSEFYMLEAELGFVESINDVIELVQEMLGAVGKAIQASPLAAELLAMADKASESGESDAITSTELAARWAGLATTKPWTRVSYADAIDFLQRAVSEGSAEFEEYPTYESGLSVAHERALCEHFGDAGSMKTPVIITDYPRGQKPFYMAPSGDDTPERPSDTVACFDLLVPGVCELIGGSMREHRLDRLVANMQSKGLIEDAEELTKGHPLNWYVDLRRYGSLPHGGFGLGFDRLIAYLAGVPNVRDVVSFPRWAGRCDG